MSPNTTQYFWLPEGTSATQILTAAKYSFLKETPAKEQNITLLDTFDGRLHRRGWQAFLRDGVLTLATGAKSPVPQAVPSPPLRAEHLPDGEVKSLLAPVIAMRALIAIARFHQTATPFRVLDELEKTVVRVTETVVKPDAPDAPELRLAKIHPLRGYDGDAAALARTFGENGATPANNCHDDIIRACGGNPGGYSSKISVQLSPDMPAADATKTLLTFILTSITTNAPFIPQDIDTEFLHDYRVAVRRTRAALAQIKSVFPVDAVTRFKHEFSILGKATNALRDLDVYLLAADDYRAMLPAHLQRAIDPLFDHLAAQRRDALAETVRALQSPRTVQLLSNWEHFLANRTDPTPPNAMLPVIKLARARIFRQYKKIIKMGRHLLKHPNDAEMHELRLVAKKLRYLLEFFASLFPPKQMKRLIKQLKILQDNLGTFNDLSVQEEFLLNTALRNPPETPWPPETALAIGALVGIFDARKAHVKTEFAAIFREFSAPENRALFQQLFAPKKDGPA